MTRDLDAAIQMLLDLVYPCVAEHIPLEYSWGRLLAEDVTADADFPPFDRSLMDGYAVRSSDTSMASPQKPAVLKQIDYIPAGSVGRYTITSGQTARIMTGASLPPGADCVVRLEDTIQNGTDIHILAGTEVYSNVGRKGGEIHQGEMVLRRGMLVDTGAMGVLAMLGKHAPFVYQRPRVGVLVTGSEIIEVAEEPVPGKIRNSNTYMLLAQIKEAGGEPVLLGKVKDETAKIVEMLRKAPRCDMIITTGGVSVGDYDLMEQVFATLGISVLFNRMTIKLGMPVLGGKWQDKLLLALSGNPAAASITFEVLLRPLIRKMAGCTFLWRPSVTAVLKDSFPKKISRRRFVWAQCHCCEQGWEVWPLFYQSNSALKSMMSANALIDVSPGDRPLSAGEKVRVMLLMSKGGEQG